MKWKYLLWALASLILIVTVGIIALNVGMHEGREDFEQSYEHQKIKQQAKASDCIFVNNTLCHRTVYLNSKEICKIASGESSFNQRLEPGTYTLRSTCRTIGRNLKREIQVKQGYNHRFNLE